MKYKMSSRATILLGRESVSRVDGAIIELVKNTYDADAGFCLICFDVKHDHIYILDNGSGMTKGIIESCWMLIGTDNKWCCNQKFPDKIFLCVPVSSKQCLNQKNKPGMIKWMDLSAFQYLQMMHCFLTKYQ